MAGSGFAQHAINVIKNNRGLLNKRKRKSKDDVYGIKSTTKLNLKKSTPSDIRRVKRQMEAYNRTLRLQSLAAFGLLLVIIYLLYLLFQ